MAKIRQTDKQTHTSTQSTTQKKTWVISGAPGGYDPAQHMAPALFSS